MFHMRLHTLAYSRARCMRMLCWLLTHIAGYADCAGGCVRCPAGLKFCSQTDTHLLLILLHKQRAGARPQVTPNQATAIIIWRACFICGVCLPQVDVGELEPRTIVSGLVKFVSVEDMTDRKVGSVRVQDDGGASIVDANSRGNRARE